MDNKLRLALTVTNLTGELKFHNEGESLPRTIKAGSALNLTNNLIGTLDVSLPKDNKAYAGIGTEFKIPTNSFALALRAGYNTRTQSDISGFNGFSMGVGFGFGSMNVDYGMVPFGDIGLTHRISMNFRFGEVREMKMTEMSRPTLSQTTSHTRETESQLSERKESPVQNNSESYKPEMTVMEREPTPKIFHRMTKSLNGQVYMVQRGDTLGKIAQRKYGDTQAWKKILEANKHLLSDSRTLEVGQKIVLP